MSTSPGPDTSSTSEQAGPSIAHTAQEIDSSLAARFCETARQHPDRIAITSNGRHLTYAELDRSSDRVARHLAALDIPPLAIAALWIDRSAAMIEAMLGVLKAGLAYLPLEATYPAARIAETLADAEPAVLITSRDLAPLLPSFSARVLLIEDLLQSSEAAAELPRSSADPDALAYVMYTSGSTGRPKGVMVSHRNVLRLFAHLQPVLGFDEHDVWTMFHSFAFDFSVWEIWGPLLHGGRLVLVPHEITRTPEAFHRLLADERVTILNQTPSAFALLNQIDAQIDAQADVQIDAQAAAQIDAQAAAHQSHNLALRLVLFGGEALSFSLLRAWFRRHGAASPRFVNAYGITETTVHVTWRDVSPADAECVTDSLLGQPIADLTLHLLDEHLRPVAPGETGELVIGGPGVALGYLRRPELTAERFVPDPQHPGARMYRSGDLACRRADGELVYLGRRDHQVKIQGFRIELGEIESALSDFPGVAQACVSTHTAPDGRKQLAAYLVEQPTASVRTAELASVLARTLPPQMLPASYTRLAALPLTVNGKLDRAALPAPGLAGPADPAPAEDLGEFEASVLALARDILHSPALGIDDHFFSAGGHSLAGTQFCLRVRERFGVRLLLRDLFLYESMREIATHIEDAILQEIEAMSEDEAARLSETAS